MNALGFGRPAALVVAFALVLIAGCGGQGATTAAPPGVADGLRDLGELLKLLADQRQKPPGKPADLDPFEPTAPHAVSAVQAKQIVYLWGNGITPGGTAVIAYDANAEAAGGAVLLQDGTVKQMTTAEFAAAPKAAKK